MRSNQTSESRNISHRHWPITHCAYYTNTHGQFYIKLILHYYLSCITYIISDILLCIKHRINYTESTNSSSNSFSSGMKQQLEMFLTFSSFKRRLYSVYAWWDSRNIWWQVKKYQHTLPTWTSHKPVFLTKQNAYKTTSGQTWGLK